MGVLTLTDGMYDGEQGVCSNVSSGHSLDQCGDDDEGYWNHPDAQSAVRAINSRSYRYLDRFGS